MGALFLAFRGPLVILSPPIKRVPIGDLFLAQAIDLHNIEEKRKTSAYRKLPPVVAGLKSSER